jgi:beta,beta-carotene 9',10'-dioxygenase
MIVKIELGGARATVRRWYEDGCYPGEPVFVARPGGDAEDDGILLSVVLDTGARASFLLVLDAATLTERARAAVPHHIPFGFHGTHFSDPKRPTDQQAPRRDDRPTPP